MKKTLTVLDGKPHVLRMDERDGASAKPRRSSLPKNLVLAVALTAVGAAFAGQTFTPRPGATVCYWDDWDCWDATPKNDVKIASFSVPALTMLVTNGVTASAWGFFLGSTSGPITFRVEKGGTGSFSGYSGGLVVAANPNETAYADICPGGTVNGTINAGRSGYGVITNAGTVAKLETCYVGEKAGSTGLWVHNGGTNSFQYPKDLYVGYNGTGTIQVVSGLFYWYGRPSFERVRVGESPAGTGRGAIVIEEGAGFRSLPIILGGRGPGAGYGELVLRGGTFENLHDNGADPGADVKGQELRPDNMWIGAATNATGAIAANTYGVIRGWGKFMAKDNNPSMKHQRSISAQLGRGVIIGDGEGQERTLDLAYFWRVTNALFTAGNTNGWYAVNKGAVMRCCRASIAPTTRPASSNTMCAFPPASTASCSRWSTVPRVAVSRWR